MDTVGYASAQVRYLPPVNAPGSAPAVDGACFAGSSSSSGVVLPCLPLEASDDARVVPHATKLVLVLPESRYAALIRRLREFEGGDSQSRPGWLVATQVVRAPEEPPPPPGVGGLRRGSLVRLRGLRGSPELNGAVGKVMLFRPERGRWDVDVEGGRGACSLRAENLELLLEGAACRGPLAAWRTSVDRGGRWLFAEVGLFLHLDKLEEVRTAAQGGGKPARGYRCTFSAGGRAALRAISNPEDVASSSAHLNVQADDFRDRDSADALEDEEGRVLALLDDVLQLHASAAATSLGLCGPGGLVSLQNPGLVEGLTMRRGPDFWRSVALWQGVQEAKIRLDGVELPPALEEKVARSLQEAREEPHGGDKIPDELMDEVAVACRPPKRLSIFDRRRLEEAVPLQRLLQADTHRERLQVLHAALGAEKRRLELHTKGPAVLPVMPESGGAQWLPDPSGRARSRL